MKKHDFTFRSRERLSDKTPIGGAGGSPRPRQEEVSEEENKDEG